MLVALPLNIHGTAAMCRRHCRNSYQCIEAVFGLLSTVVFSVTSAACFASTQPLLEHVGHVDSDLRLMSRVSLKRRDPCVAMWARVPYKVHGCIYANRPGDAGGIEVPCVQDDIGSGVCINAS